jgi:hypothetical protein
MFGDQSSFWSYRIGLFGSCFAVPRLARPLGCVQAIRSTSLSDCYGSPDLSSGRAESPSRPTSREVGAAQYDLSVNSGLLSSCSDSPELPWAEFSRSWEISVSPELLPARTSSCRALSGGTHLRSRSREIFRPV